VRYAINRFVKSVLPEIMMASRYAGTVQRIKENGGIVEMINQFSGAVLDHTRSYRFLLWRFWDERFVGINPSTANELNDDPTVRRLCSFARNWGYGGLYVCNLSAYISSLPEVLDREEAFHKANYPAVKMASSLSVLTVVGWGDLIKHVPNGKTVANYVVKEYLDEPMCFGLTKSGNPKHPLYLPGDAELKEYC